MLPRRVGATLLYVAGRSPVSVNPVMLSASSVSHRYGRRVLFSDLSLELENGSRTAIVGPNGSGKSTLLRILGGLLTPSSGTVQLKIGSRVIESSVRPVHVGLVAPYLNLYDGLSAAENLHFIRRMRGARIASKRVDALLEEVGLADRSADLVATFSSGMLQRLRLAAALLPDPEVLLLDEPSITLDDAGARILDRAVQQASDDGRIVVTATNVTEEAARYDTILDLAAHAPNP